MRKASIFFKFLCFFRISVLGIWMPGRLLKGGSFCFSHLVGRKLLRRGELKAKGNPWAAALWMLFSSFFFFFLIFFKLVTFHPRPPKTNVVQQHSLVTNDNKSQCFRTVQRCARTTGPLTEHVSCFLCLFK